MKLRNNLTQVGTFFLYWLTGILIPYLEDLCACPVESRLRRVRNAEFHRVNLRLRQKWKVNG